MKWNILSSPQKIFLCFPFCFTTYTLCYGLAKYIHPHTCTHTHTLTNAILWGTTLWGIFCQHFIYSVVCVYICTLKGYCVKLCYSLGVFTLLKSRHFDPTIYTCAKKSRSFSFTKLHNFLVGSAHVRSQATVHAFMHAAACCMHEGRGYTDGSTQGHVMKNRDISRLAFTLANFAWNFATFQKNRTPACDFSGDVSRVFMRCC